jgi:hypothetical protein
VAQEAHDIITGPDPASLYMYEVHTHPGGDWLAYVTLDSEGALSSASTTRLVGDV